jgi:hypothetical protein
MRAHAWPRLPRRRNPLLARCCLVVLLVILSLLFSPRVLEIQAQDGTLKDTFDDNTLDAARWRLLYADDGTVKEQHGQLEIQAPAGSSEAFVNGYQSSMPWDLSLAEASVEVIQASNDSSSTIFTLFADSSNLLRFVVSQGQLRLEARRYGTWSISPALAYDANAYRFWRFRDRVDDIAFETSPDGLNWTVRRAVSWPYRDALYFRLSVAAPAFAGVTGLSVFDNFLMERSSGIKPRLPDGFTLVQLSGKLINPTAIVAAPDGTIFVAQQNGLLYAIKHNQLGERPLLTLPVDTTGERGSIQPFPQITSYTCTTPRQRPRSTIASVALPLKVKVLYKTAKWCC